MYGTFLVDKVKFDMLICDFSIKESQNNFTDLGHIRERLKQVFKGCCAINNKYKSSWLIVCHIAPRSRFLQCKYTHTHTHTQTRVVAVIFLNTPLCTQVI